MKTFQATNNQPWNWDSLALEGMSHLSGDGAHLIPTLEVSEQPDKSAPNQAKVDASVGCA